MASPGIEPGSGASETLILSIVLRGRAAKLRVFVGEISLYQPANIRSKDLHGDGQEDHSEKFTDSDESAGSEEFRNIFQGMQHQVNYQEVQQDCDQDRPGTIVGFKRNDGCECTRACN